MMFQCQRCGWCCKNVVINVSYSDIVRWLHQERNDVLKEISFINNYPRKGTGGFYIAKTTFNPKRPCPFLEDGETSICKIYDTRPVACRDAPLGYTKFYGCPAFNKTEIPEATRNKIKKRQYQDFRKAHNNWKQLLNILVETRRR